MAAEMDPLGEPKGIHWMDDRGGCGAGEEDAGEGLQQSPAAPADPLSGVLRIVRGMGERAKAISLLPGKSVKVASRGISV